jgi:hypothetical protein
LIYLPSITIKGKSKVAFTFIYSWLLHSLNRSSTFGKFNKEIVETIIENMAILTKKTFNGKISAEYDFDLLTY